MGEDSGRIFVNGAEYALREPLTLAQAIARYSPFGQEPVLATVGSVTYRSIDDLDGIVLKDGDGIELFPLIIGG